MDRAPLSLSFAPAFTNVDAARKAIADFCRTAFGDAIAVSFADDLCLAATEALNNAVEHAGAQSIGVKVAATDTEVVVCIVNDGEQFDPTGRTAMPSFDDGPELPEGGFGLAIVRLLVDELSYDHRDGRNVLCMKKRIRADGDA